MKSWFLLLLLLITCFISTNAQDTRTEISGLITDVDNKPLTDVTIQIKGTHQAAKTNRYGKFNMLLPAGLFTISASCIGYNPKEQTLIVSHKRLFVTFRLTNELKIIDNVVASGSRTIVVQDSRTGILLNEMPQSVSIIGQKTIKEQAVIDLETITRNMTGINFTGNYSGAGSYQFFNARGFDLNDRQSYRLNGIMIWNLGNNYTDNIEQVEFLKGPTSVLFGDVAPGGVLNFITKKPLPDFSATLNFKTGSWGLFRPALDISGPVTADGRLKFRINASVENTRSFRDFVKAYRSFIAPTLTFDFTPRLSATIETVFKRSRATDDAGLISPDGTVAGLKRLGTSLYLGEPSHQYLYSEQDYFAAFHYKTTQKWNFNTIIFYGNTNNRPFGVWFESPDSAGDFIRRQYGYHQNSKTLSASSTLSGIFKTAAILHTVFAGVDFQESFARVTNQGNLYYLDSSNLQTPVHKPDTNVPGSGPFLPYVSELKQASVFAQDQLSFFSGSLHLLLGFRAGKSWQGNHNFEQISPGLQPMSGIITKNSFIPRIGIVLKKFNWSVYGSYSMGYEINTPDLFAHNYADFQSPPATQSVQYEVGFKGYMLDKQISLSVSIFKIDKYHAYGYVYLNQLHPDFDAYDVYYQGHHRSQGIEVEISGQLTKGLTLNSGAALLNTRVVTDPDYQTGNQLPAAPKYSVNGWLDYAFDGRLKGLSVGSGYFFKGSYFSSLANSQKFKIPKSSTVDATIAYTYKKACIQLNLKNLTNQISYSNPWQFNMFEIKPLRQFILTLSYQLSKRENKKSVNLLHI